LIGKAAAMAGRLRPFGVKLIAVYLFARAVLLALAGTIAHMKPEMRPELNEFMSELEPILLRLHAVDYAFLVAPVFGFAYAIVALGIWNLQKWARTMVVLNLLYVFVSTGFALAVVAATNRKMLQSHPISPYFIVDVLAGFLVLGCLLDPDVKKAFNLKLDEFE
jgi:hypothetical protein